MKLIKMDIVKEYTKEDLEIDVNWLIDQGVDESEAEPFILKLLNSKYTD